MANNDLQTLFANLGSKGTQNSRVIDAIQSFLGPESEGAKRRMNKTKKLVEKLTTIPDNLKALAKMTGMEPAVVKETYKNMIHYISGDEVETAGFGGFNPVAYGFDGAGAQFEEGEIGLPGWDEQKISAIRQSQYLQSQLSNPSPEFAQEMIMAAILPIARQMIPNTVFLKAFITDMAINEISKPYFLKRRYPAFQVGLSNYSSQQPPQAIQTYDPVLVTPTEWDRPISIDMKYIEMLNFDVAADILSDGGRELQVLIDSAAFKGLDFLVPVQTPPGVGTTVNGFQLDSTGTCMTLENGINPQVEHLNFANMILRNRGYNPDLMITSPYELATLMSEQAVLMAYAYGTREVQETGLVGTLLGNAVAWTPNLWQKNTSLVQSPSSYVMWVCDSDELARTVLGKPISVFPDFSRRRIDFDLYTRLEIFFRNVNATVRIQCSNTEPGIQ